MKTEYRYLPRILGAYLREEKPEVCDYEDWNALMKLAQIHSVIGILGYMGKKYPICPDARMAGILRRQCLNTVGLFTQRQAMAETMSAELEKAGIDHILMKGYVLREFYPVPELRTFNDIDIVIRPEDRKKCDGLMMRLGFQRHTDWEPVYSYFRENELYEIHTEIMEIDVSDRADYRGYFRSLWDHVERISKHSYRFTPEYHFLYLLVHIAKHVYSSGAGIRMYLDVAAFLQHYGDGLNWEWVCQQLELLQLQRFADVVFSAAESWFDISCAVPHDRVPEQVLEEFLTFTMEAGTFGHYQRDTALTSLKHENQEKNTTRIRQILKNTFPDARTIQSRYTYLQDKPWLLPAAWVHRLVKNKEKLRQRTKEMKQIISADTEEVRKMQQLMRDVGL